MIPLLILVSWYVDIFSFIYILFHTNLFGGLYGSLCVIVYGIYVFLHEMNVISINRWATWFRPISSSRSWLSWTFLTEYIRAKLKSCVYKAFSCFKMLWIEKYQANIYKC
jgi:hypothetical protein